LANNYPREDTLVGVRNQTPPPANARIASKDVRDIARRLVEDKDYQENLQKRLQEGTAGPMEIWLWRWAYGDPKKAEAATEEKDAERYAAHRQHVLALIRTRPEQARDLEDRILGPVIPMRALPSVSGGSRDPLFDELAREEE
jgi:hypothetical protein